MIRKTLFIGDKQCFWLKNTVFRLTNIAYREKHCFSSEKQSFLMFHTSGADKLCLSQKKLCFSFEKQSLLVDKQCLSNWEVEFFDKLCFSIEKHSLSVDKQSFSIYYTSGLPYMSAWKSQVGSNVNAPSGCHPYKLEHLLCMLALTLRKIRFASAFWARTVKICSHHSQLEIIHVEKSVKLRSVK